MANKTAKPSRKSIRLTFRVAGDQVQLISQERLQMMTPPSVGAPPEAGKHGGFWVELRDTNNRVLHHRMLHFPLADSVEVFSPEGKIRREFGPTQENIFEVLVPDYDDASDVALFGEYLDAEGFRKRKAERMAAGEPEPASRELARFQLSKETPNQGVEHGHE